VGEGTFKQTFQVETSDASYLALKIYKTAGISRREKREVDAMLRCDHRNIARLISIDYYTYDAQQFFTTVEEFLPGGTLTAKGQITPSQCLDIGEQLIDALAHIANLRLVHRDIKPDNIMFRGDKVTPVT
jgi:serine/threonine protein kinase